MLGLFVGAAGGARGQAAATTNAPVVKLTPVVVTATMDTAREKIAPSLGAVTYKIDTNQIQSIPQGENAPFQQVLLRTPGVVEDQDGLAHIRGEDGNIQYRVNGVLLPEGLNGFAQEIDTRLINTLTVITGTLPAQFGFRTAAVADIQTKTGYQLNGSEASLYGGSYNTIEPSLQSGGSGPKLDYFVTTSFKQTDLGIDNTTSSPTPLHDRSDQEKAFGYFSYLLDDTSRLTLIVNASYSDYQIPDIPNQVPQFDLAGHPTANSASINENQNEQSYYGVLSYQKTTDNLSWQASAFSSFGQINFTPDTVNDLIFQGLATHEINSTLANGLQVDASFDVGADHTVRSGLLATYEIERLDTSTAVFPTTNGLQSSTTPFTIVEDSGNDGSFAGVYLQDEWRLTESLTLNYGGRYDRFDAFVHQDQFSPRANFVWQIDKDTVAHIGYARYFTPPTLQYVKPALVDKFADTSNSPDQFKSDPPLPQRSHYFDAGLSRQITPAWQVTGDGYYESIRNLLDLGQFGSPISLVPLNYRYGIIYGAEFGTSYRQGPFSAFGNFSFVHTSARDVVSTQYQLDSAELAYIQTHNIQVDHQGRYTGSAGLSYTWARTLFYLDGLYGDGLRAGFANLEKLPRYFPVSLGAQHIIPLKAGPVRAVKLRFDCVNVFDEIYELRNGTGVGVAAPSFGPRRSFYGGISADF